VTVQVEFEIKKALNKNFEIALKLFVSYNFCRLKGDEFSL